MEIKVVETIAQSLLPSVITTAVLVVLLVLIVVFLVLFVLLLNSSCSLTGTTGLVSTVGNVVSGTHDLVFSAIHTVAAAGMSVSKAALTRH